MRFRYHLVDTLPPLAWCARIPKGTGLIDVFHGRGVEIFPHSFVEGAWDGPFEDGAFAMAKVIAGTGAVVTSESVRFTGSTDQLSPLFSIVHPGVVFVSNSPVFVLKVAGERLDPIYPFYTYDFLCIWRKGLYCPAGNLKTDSPNPLRVHFSTVVAIDPAGKISYSAHTHPGPPEDFAAYRTLLDEGVAKVFANAVAPNRSTVYRPLAAISRGYDSTATAVLASRAGCREAFSFRDSRAADPIADNGEENAKRLGMACVSPERWRYLEFKGRTEPEFAMVAKASQNPLAAMEDLLPGRILVAGYFGDNIWDPCRSDFCRELSKPWIRTAGGLSQLEFRLRAGYLLFAPAYIGARHNREIHSIAISETMRPWYVGGNYDRPLARRLGEDAGLPRDSFGTKKMYTAHSHISEKTSFSHEAWMAYQSFLKRSHSSVPWISYQSWQRLAQSRHFLWRNFGCRHYRYVPPTRWQRRLSFLLNTHPRLLSWETMFTFQWAVDALAPRYEFSHGKEHEPLAHFPPLNAVVCS